MGLLRSMNVGTVVADATKAKRENRPVFIAQIADSPRPRGMSSALPTMSEMIEGVEAVGWTLDMLTAAGFSDGDRPVALAVFRANRQPVMRS